MERELTYLAFTGVIDPPRAEARAAVGPASVVVWADELTKVVGLWLGR